ncbi:alpha/beta hydrolase (plasmid) [Rhodococcus sp. USK10]|uniref:alpha/beta fold hydrolase n=1 Tax=Rhodococcus sp. USK10 TaxID=2789739 RepID=UPI001C5F6B64|nr:alpha/beta hydrolase [Rhodococcus sp. USK10]QYA99820.1 alpha/beta hydrolase [Rhodococcus sp. USK10]
MKHEGPTPGMTIAGVDSRYLEAISGAGPGSGRVRSLHGGTGPPVVLLHTVRTQAEHFHRLIPLLLADHSVFALDLPGMGHSDIVPGASYEEPAMRSAVTGLLEKLDLQNVTLIGESMGAVLALTAAVAVPDRVRRVIAVNAYDYPGGIARSSALARVVVSGILAPGVGPMIARVEPRPVLRAILRGGLVEKSCLTGEYLDELHGVGRRPGYPVVARAVYANLPSLVAARRLYPQLAVPVDLVYGEDDWSRVSDRENNRRLLPDATFTQVPGAGHFLTLEKPEVVAALVR